VEHVSDRGMIKLRGFLSPPSLVSIEQNNKNRKVPVKLNSLSLILRLIFGAKVNTLWLQHNRSGERVNPRCGRVKHVGVRGIIKQGDCKVSCTRVYSIKQGNSKLLPYMRKAGIIKDISKQTGIESGIVKTVIEKFATSVMEHIVNKEYVALSRFGRFGFKKRAAKIGRNISENKPVKVPAHFIPTFKPSKRFKEKMKESHCKN
jgi:DNA-binding protein HU-beta